MSKPDDQIDRSAIVPLVRGLAAIADLMEPCGCESAEDGTPLRRCAEHSEHHEEQVHV